MGRKSYFYAPGQIDTNKLLHDEFVTLLGLTGRMPDNYTVNL